MFVLLAVVVLTLSMHGCEVFVQIWLSAWTGRGGETLIEEPDSPANDPTAEEMNPEGRQVEEGATTASVARDQMFYGVFAGAVLGIVLLTSANAVSFFIIAIRYIMYLSTHILFICAHQ